MSSAVYERAISAFPISVGTSLALESLFQGPMTPIDPERKIPQHVEITDNQEFWINASTLFRNLFTAIPRDHLYQVTPRDCSEAMLIEMQQIDELVRSESLNKTKVVYYYCSYKSIEKELKGITARKANTDKQKKYEKIKEETLKLVLSNIGNYGLEIEKFDTFIRPRMVCKALIMTHYTVDLLTRLRFKSLDLLESHTGVLKKYPLWYTKYFNGRDLNMLPFNEFLLKIFGDNELIHPYHFKVRDVIKQVAIDFKWNYATSMSKIHSDISKIKDHFVRNELIKLM